MLDDHTMDKKNRSTQSLNKGNVPESKKSQDAATNKQIPKQSRRREPAGSVPKNETSGRNKPMPQKFKSFDKRPKPRGSFAGGKEGPKINLYEDEPELGSLYTPGSKKQSLNHLLNFQYAPPSSYGAGGGRSSYGNRSQSRGMDYSMGYNNFLMQSLASVHKHKYNKEQFLQANCQFVVRLGEDYGIHLGDPDQLVKWEYIQQIRGFGNEDIKCPICLDLPRAPQMTRCGHCFCWPCILHYLALSDKSWRKCPICYEAVHLGDLKSFRSVIKRARAVNEEVTFQLMKRERGSTVVSPVAQWDFHPTDMLMNVSETQLDTTYAKLLTASVDDILDIIQSEEIELTLLLEELGREQCPTLCFTERALELLNKRKADIFGKMGQPGTSLAAEETSATQDKHQFEAEDTVHPQATSAISNNSVHGNDNVGGETKDSTDNSKNLESVMNAIDVTQYVGSDKPGQGQDDVHSTTIGVELEEAEGIEDQTCDLLSTSYDSNTRSRYESVSSEDLGSTGAPAHRTTSIRAEDLDIGPPSHSTSSGVPHRYFYFYQAMDGQQLFLHAVNVRMLEMTYGSLENCPHTITGRILEKETGSMTEELRHRLRYLQHLPVTCQFEVAEIALAPPLISDDTVERFRDQLASRERRRLKRAREDKRRSARIEEAEYVQMRGGGSGVQVATGRRRGNLHIESRHQFPECGVGGIAPSLSTSASTESSRASSPRRPELRAGSSLNAEDNAVFWPSVGERHRTVSEETDMPLLSSPPNSAYKLSLAQMLGSNTPGIHIEGECDYLPTLSSPPNSAYKLSLAQMLGSNTPGIHIEGECDYLPTLSSPPNSAYKLSLAQMLGSNTPGIHIEGECDYLPTLSSPPNSAYKLSLAQMLGSNTPGIHIEGECDYLPTLSSPPNSAYKLSLAQMLGSNTPGIHIEGEQHRGTATGSIQNSGSNTNNNNSSKKKKRKQQTLLFATGGNRARE
ncbi:hypothetical protein M8J76_008913 [Diaphorina citri]|nr:hypothetical protein M8J76_008913 [Diaphorina citri]